MDELRAVLAEVGTAPVILLGYYWGAWLVYLLASRYPDAAGKLVLISSGPFEAEYVNGLHVTRLSRLSVEEREEFNHILGLLNGPVGDGRDEDLARLGALATKADGYDLLEDPCQPGDMVGLSGEIYQGIWSEVAQMRKNGELLSVGKQISVPVIAIHGKYDLHPGEGVRGPLSGVLEKFRLIWLERCGHIPWREAQDEFYRLIEMELPLL